MSLVGLARGRLRKSGLLLATLLVSATLGLLADLHLPTSAEAASYYSRSYGGSIRHGRGRTHMRRTHHNRHARRSKSRRSGSGRSGYYRHGSVSRPTSFKSSDKYGPPRKYNPYRKRK